MNNTQKKIFLQASEIIGDRLWDEACRSMQKVGDPLDSKIKRSGPSRFWLYQEHLEDVYLSLGEEGIY